MILLIRLARHKAAGTKPPAFLRIAARQLRSMLAAILILQFLRIGILNMENNHAFTLPDSHADISQGYIPDLRHRFDRIIHSIPKQRVYVLRFHKRQLGPVDHTLQLDGTFPAYQGLVRQQHIQRIIARTDS